MKSIPERRAVWNALRPKFGRLEFKGSKYGFIGIDLSSFDLSNCLFQNSSFKDAKLQGTDFHGSRFTQVDFSGALFDARTNLKNTIFWHCTIPLSEEEIAALGGNVVKGPYR